MNDIVGLIIHSPLLTPYHSWKISHRKHHSNTGSCENDEVFVPFTEAQIKSNPFHIVSDSPMFNMLKVIFYLLLGWMPSYLGKYFVLKLNLPVEMVSQLKSNFFRF